MRQETPKANRIGANILLGLLSLLIIGILTILILCVASILPWTWAYPIILIYTLFNIALFLATLVGIFLCGGHF